jgi:hypothetical protein
LPGPAATGALPPVRFKEPELTCRPYACGITPDSTVICGKAPGDDPLDQAIRRFMDRSRRNVRRGLTAAVMNAV